MKTKQQDVQNPIGIDDMPVRTDTIKKTMSNFVDIVKNYAGDLDEKVYC